MQLVPTTEWKRLSGFSRVSYRVNEDAELAVHADMAGLPPFTLPSAFYAWTIATRHGAPVDEFVLRTSGEPSTMRRIVAAFGAPARSASDRMAVDERILLTTIACESGRDPTHPSGRDLRSPRTEKGYPGRTGENDHGDPQRDALDWDAYIRSGGVCHSSHGLMQTLISTAVAAAPRFFVGKPPELYRSVLWDPDVSIECGAAYFKAFPEEDRLDPLRARFRYGAGRVYGDPRNRWGARIYLDPRGVPAEGPVVLNYIAFWNDLIAVLRGVTT